MTHILAALAAATAPVPDAWIDAVEHIESSGRGEATPDGDGGKASGPFQFWSVAWADCSKVRKAQGLPTYPYSKAKDRKAAREYARTWLTHLRDRLHAQIGRQPNAAETWLAYNLGFTGFARHDFQWGLVPQAKFDKALLIMKMTGDARSK